MKTNRTLSLFVLAFLMMLASSVLASHVEFESLPLGTIFGNPVGNSPGDYLFNEDGADVFISNFISGGAPYFHYCSIDPSFGTPIFFQNNNIMQVNNVGVVFDFNISGSVTFDFLYFGGSVNLQVNGFGTVLEGPDIPSLAGVLAPGISMTVTTVPVGGGHKGTATITGPVQRLRIGGQEFFLDNVRGGGSVVPEECDYEVTHQSLAPGMGWGASYGQGPGDFMFIEDGIPVFCEYFQWENGGGTLGNCVVDFTPVVSFGADLVMGLNNINNVYDISVLGLTTSEVNFEYLDFGGTENLQVNGGPLHVGDLEAMPNNVAPGVTLTVTTYPVGGGNVRAYVVLTGNVQKLMVGGQEFFVDNVCVVEDGEPEPNNCDLVVDNESRSVGEAWGGSYGQSPGDLIFIEDGIDVRLARFDYGSGFAFNEASITNPYCGILTGNAMWLNNIMVGFDLLNVQPVIMAKFDFCDCGGMENLAINGMIYVGELEDLPVGYFGADIQVQIDIQGFDSCKFGTVTITGNLQYVGVGGQEFQIDNFCVVQDGSLVGTPDLVASSLQLGGNYPNPFNPSTTIEFSTAHHSWVNLTVIDLAGRRVQTLLNGTLEAGQHKVFWDGRDSRGGQAATGIYFVQLSDGQRQVSRKITMIK
jgi:hypothetical protein